MKIPILEAGSILFPDIRDAILNRRGLVAIGGDLSVDRLLSAYQQGIFPWYSEGEPICWWALAPRTILIPFQIHIGRSLKKTLRNKQYRVTANMAFEEVIIKCAEIIRPNQEGTWINVEMQDAYINLHHAGYAHSFECWYFDENKSPILAGGFYGVQIGCVFFGESMFASLSDGSKIAFATGVNYLNQCGIELIDCQMKTEHLARFGSVNIEFSDFENALKALTKKKLNTDIPKKEIISQNY